MKTDSLASGNHFLPFSQIAFRSCSFFFSWNIFFSQSFIPAGENEFLPSGNNIFLIPNFFLVMENITDIIEI